ncbi:MAG: L,D-transpeptidase, partial [Patescibacteria group bacterium]
MIYKKLLSGTVAILLGIFFPVTGVFALENDPSEDVAGSENFDELNVVIDGGSVNKDKEATPKGQAPVIDKDEEEPVVTEHVENINTGDDVCGFEVPEKKTYGAQLIAIRRQLRVEPGKNFRVKIFMKNTGSMPWFSNKSECLGPKMSLGTDRERDRDSYFYDENLHGWEASNRIGMDQYRADPGSIASFTFLADAGKKADVYKEYFTPVLKDLQWIDDAQFSFEVMVGDTGESASDIRKKMMFAGTSGPVTDIDLNAPKTFVVDLSEQNLYVKLGDNVVRTFRVSSGAPATPTPVGETNILLKQWVRVGAKPPHYVMPRFMMFRAGGYGFHALPSLGG